jgi:1,4-alpha-glucan branching enzyme
MFRKNASKGSVCFGIKPSRPAKKVLLAASFNEWKPVACKKQKDGTYTVTVKLTPGTYEYKFIVDEEWVVDPDNPTWAMNHYGTFNSVAQVAS